MNNLTIGGVDRFGQPYTYYETVAGGHGASSRGPGLSGKQSHMTNTANTPIEALEQIYPFRVETYALRSQSGGEGKHRGGDGVVRTYVFDREAQVTLFSSRRKSGPYGLNQGQPGAPGKQFRVSASGERSEYRHHLPCGLRRVKSFTSKHRAVAVGGPSVRRTLWRSKRFRVWVFAAGGQPMGVHPQTFPFAELVFYLGRRPGWQAPFHPVCTSKKFAGPFGPSSISARGDQPQSIASATNSSCVGFL